MDIVVIGSTFVRNEERRHRPRRFPVNRSKRIDRRRNRKDRRKSVGDGVVVKLSYPNDRRINPDRRRSGSK